MSDKDKKIHKRVKTPTVLQMEALECGAASLAMILGYHGLFIPLEQLRIECGVSRDGSKASNILKAARKFGMDAKGFKKEPQRLKECDFPVIIHWNFNHFLVLEGFKKDKVYLNDPASGPRVISMEEFDECFTGVVIEFTKGENFKKGGSKKNIYKALFKRLKGVERSLLFISLTGLFLVIPGIVIPVFSRIFVDNVLVANMSSWLKPLLLGMGITALLRFLLTWLRQHYLLKLETKLALSSSASFFKHVLKLPMEFFDQRYSGEISSRVQSNDKIANIIADKLTSNFINLLSVIFYVFIMIQYDFVLTMFGVLIASVNILFLKLISRKREDLNQKLLIDSGKLLGTSMAGISAIETLKAGGTENDFFSKWAGYQASTLNSSQKLGFSTQLLALVPSFLTTVNTSAILIVGGLRVMQGNMTIGMLIAFQSLMTSFIDPVNKIVELGGEMQQITGDMNRLDDVLDYRTDPLSCVECDIEIFNSSKSSRLQGFVDIDNIDFGYNVLEPPLIQQFSLKLEPGSRVALVGGSGSGKSTIAKIVSGLNKPWKGEVLFDKEIKNKNNKHIIDNSLAVVDQDIVMFEGSLRDNLTLWDSSVSDAKILKALKDACIYDDVMERSGGLDQKILEGGTNYSGGQRQRLEIARALVNNPSILILDEATSALDPKTEKRIDENLRKRGCTCIIVAHRLSTIRDCDEIIVLKNGKVIQRGTHDELINVEGHYSELIAAH